jgi:undecaprenyl pyrophosphate synthase
MKRFETKLEKELQDIKALLLELFERDERSKSENEIRGIMKLFEISMKDFFEDEVLYSISDKYKTRESI